MRRFLPACLLLALPLMAACTTPGYDYRARMVPTFPEAAAYRDVQVGQFRGPAGNVAEEEFARMLGKIGLDEVARCPEEVERIFAAADADRDGGVTFAEFKGLLTQTVQARQARRGP